MKQTKKILISFISIVSMIFMVLMMSGAAMAGTTYYFVDTPVVEDYEDYNGKRWYCNVAYDIDKNSVADVVDDDISDGYYTIRYGVDTAKIRKEYISTKKNATKTVYVIKDCELKKKYSKDYFGIEGKYAYTGFSYDVLPGVEKGKLTIASSTGIYTIDESCISYIEPRTKYTNCKLAIKANSDGTGKTIKTVARNKSINVVSKKNKKGYVKVQYEVYSNYQLKQYIGYVKATSICESCNVDMYAQAKVAVYSKTGGKGKKLGYIKSGSKVLVLSTTYSYIKDKYIASTDKKNYYKVMYKGKAGYVKGYMLSTKKPLVRYMNIKGNVYNSKNKTKTLKFNTKVTLIGGQGKQENYYIIYKGNLYVVEAYKLSNKKQKASVKDRYSASNIYRLLVEMEKDYPEGTYYTNDIGYSWRGGIYSIGYGCAGFAFMLSDRAFGNIPARMYTNITLDTLKNKVRVGDILRVNYDTHTVIVLKKLSDGVIVAEGNYNSSVHWGRKITYTELLQNCVNYMTRYPQ